jgi:hypothetical protein
MCAVYAVWGLFAIVVVLYGPVAWFAFSGLLLLYMASTRVPHVVRSRSASAFFAFGVPLLGICVAISVAIGIGVADPANWKDPEHEIQLGWVSDKNESGLWDDGTNSNGTYACNLVDWSTDEEGVFAFADDPKDVPLHYVGRPLGRFYLVLEWHNLKFHQFVQLEDAPPRFRLKLASLHTDPRHKKQGLFIR